MCRDEVTLYNYIEERNGKAVYTATILRNVFVREKQEIESPGNAMRTFHLSIFDQCVKAESQTGQPKRMVLRAEWEKAPNKAGIWTVDGAFRGKDCVVVGRCDAPEPPRYRYRITTSEYCGKGSLMTRHWSVKGA